MPYFIKVNKSWYNQNYLEAGVFIDYTIPEWPKKDNQEIIKDKYRDNEILIQRLLRHLPSDKTEIIRELYYGLKQTIDLGNYKLYIEPTLNEILDLFNGIINEDRTYDNLKVKSRFKDLNEMWDEYYTILNDNTLLREQYKQEEKKIVEDLIEARRKASESIRYTEIWKDAGNKCKDKYNSLFHSIYKRMRSYSDEARIFFYDENNLQYKKDYDFQKWNKLRYDWVYWDHSFHFSDFSPFEKKFKSSPIDLSTSEEDQIMRALRNGDGDIFGFQLSYAIEMK